MHGTLLLGYLSDDKLDHIANVKTRSLVSKCLFHDQMSAILEPLVTAGVDGVEMVCADGNLREVHPILASYICDHPEQCLVACIKHSHCPVCEAPPKKRGVLTKFPIRRRQKIINAIQTHLDRVRDLKKDFTRLGLRPIKPFWTDLPLVDDDTLFTPDILHQLHKGMFQVHLLSWMKSLMTEKEIDNRFKAISSFPGLRHFKNGVSHLSQMTGKEQKEMEKVLMIVIAGQTNLPKKAMVAASGLLNFIYLARYPAHSNHTLKLMENALRTFHANKQIFIDRGVCPNFNNIPKLHSMMHYAGSIRSKGSADGYSTESPERLHIDFAKKGYRASNKNNFIIQMIRWLIRQENMNYQRAYLAWCAGYTSFIDQGGGKVETDSAWDLDIMDVEETSESPKEDSPLINLPDVLPSILDFTVLSAPEVSKYRIARKPTQRYQSFRDIEKRFQIIDFYWYFHDYFRHLNSEIDKGYEGGKVGLDVWNTFWLPIPQFQDVFSSSQWQKVSAIPAHQRQPNFIHGQ